MESVWNQAFTLIGVLVGTVGTILATTAADRSRWRRSQSVRWDERRLQAYMDYARALKEAAAIAHRMTAHARPGAKVFPIERDAAVAQLAEIDLRRTAQWEAVLMLGDETTVNASGEWREAVRDLVFVSQEEPFDHDRWLAALENADEKRDEFYVAARASMAVGGGIVRQASSLRDRYAGAGPPGSPSH
jgi:hypothetical protein